jgi:cysteinyl-tRNA synthetase
LDKITVSKQSSFDVNTLVQNFYAAMNDDFNAPILVAHLFDAVKHINLINDGKETISESDKILLTKEISSFVEVVLGLELTVGSTDSKLNPVMDLVIELRQQARENKDWTTSDKIRDGLAAAGIVIKDGKDGTTWD